MVLAAIVGCAQSPRTFDPSDEGEDEGSSDAGFDEPGTSNGDGYDDEDLTPSDDDESSEDPSYDDESDDDEDMPPESDAPTGQRDAGARDGGPSQPDARVHDASAPDAAPTEGDGGVGGAVRDANGATGRDAALAPTTSPSDAGTRSPQGSTVPSDAGMGTSPLGCVAGTYRGVFNGDISALGGFVQIRIAGDTTIDLTGTVGARELAIQNGKLQGADQSGNPIEARITGRVDCRTHQVLNGQLLSGSYRRRDPIWGGLPITVGFSGRATGTFFDDPPSAIGRWEVTNDRGTRSGSGTWTARIQN